LKLEQIIAIFILLLAPSSFVYVDALQQSADEIIVNISPGETQNVTWGLKSDKENEITSVEVRVEGEGSEFLSFRKNIELEPQQTLWTIITFSIPDDYPGGIELKPHIFATEFQPVEGQVSFNIVMEKTLHLNIAPNDDPSLWVDWDEIKKVGAEETVMKVVAVLLQLHHLVLNSQHKFSC